MSLPSFKEDLNKEKWLSPFIDSQYTKYLRQYSTRRVHSMEEQLKGVDVWFINNLSQKEYAIDEKAQLDYLNEDLPTFAFEIKYSKKGTERTGWFLDKKKVTQFYSLITGIQVFDNLITHCKIHLVNRAKLISKMEEFGIGESYLLDFKPQKHGRIQLKQLDQIKQGFLFYSLNNKMERPLNLILKLDWLVQIGVAKRLC